MRRRPDSTRTHTRKGADALFYVTAAIFRFSGAKCRKGCLRGWGLSRLDHMSSSDPASDDSLPTTGS
eukprot:5060882-Alexandrium_andersonii.AAC.1